MHGIEACDLDDRTIVHNALDGVTPKERQKHPACMAVRACLMRLDGHVDQAIGLFEQALKGSEGDDDLYVRIADQLLPLYYVRRNYSRADELFESALRRRPHDIRILSSRALARAARNDKRGLNDVEELIPPPDIPDNIKARVYLRLSGTAYGLGRINIAEKYALIAAELGETCGSSRLSSTAYQNLCSLYSNDVTDVGLALHYSDLMADAAMRAGDKVQWLIALCVRYSIAAEIGNRALLLDIREQLKSHRGAEKYAERIAVVLADSLHYAWDGNFDLMQQYLQSVSLDRIADPQKALVEAALAIAQCGVSDEEGALNHAYRALTLGRPRSRYSSFDNRLRLVARALASSVLIRCNRRSEAIRMLDAFTVHMTLSLRRLMEAVATDSFDNLRETAPDLCGYGMALNALKAKIGNTDDAVNLTEREREILQACAKGETSKSIARKLSIDESTVVWHRNNILKKFGVQRMLGAIEQARSLGLIR